MSKETVQSLLSRFTDAHNFRDYVNLALYNNRKLPGTAAEWFNVAQHRLTVARTALKYAKAIEGSSASGDQLAALDAQNSRQAASHHVIFAHAQRRVSRSMKKTAPLIPK